MKAKAASEFRQRGAEYSEREDGLNFKGWYGVDDIKRVLWKQFRQLDPALTKDTLHPFVFLDSLDNYTIEDMLNPLITKLKSSSKKYFPFIFKPELGTVHYVAGFLRKNEDKTVSIILFNPTGTTPRRDFGNYAYQLSLMKEEDDFEIQKNTLYFKIHKNALQYTVINPVGNEVTATFSAEDLNKLGIVLDLNKPLTADLIKEQLRPKKAEILEMTLASGNTEKKIEIISSSKKIQTQEKDGGPLVSCGPLTLAFTEYLMLNPEYMAKLDKDFHLPEFLDLDIDDESKYKMLVTSLRKKHYEVLSTVEDSAVESGEVDASYAEVTDAVLTSLDSEEPTDQEAVGDDLWPDQDDPDNGANWDVEENDGFSLSEETQERVTPVDDRKPSIPAVSEQPPKPADLKVDPETREDVKFVRSQINRFRENAQSCISFKNEMKANKIEQALKNALVKGVADVRTDQQVKDALAFHRIFSFFGLKVTKATNDLEESLERSPPKK